MRYIFPSKIINKAYFYIYLVLVILKLSNGVSVTIHNLNMIETINSSEPLTFTLHFEKPELLRFASFNNNKFCIAVDGVICNCEYGNDGLYIHPRCLSTAWQRIWLSVIIIDGHNHTATLPIIIRNRSIVGISTQIDGDESLTKTRRSSSKITLVLPLTLDDISRFLILINSLSKLSSEIIEELLIFVPDNQRKILNLTIEVLISLYKCIYTWHLSINVYRMFKNWTLHSVVCII